MGKIVFTEFGSMDFAEIAARNVRHKFEGISKIKIKYKHLDKDGYNDMEYVILPPSSFTNGSFGTGFPQSYTAVTYQADREPSNLNQTSSVSVYADNTVAGRVASYLRGLGGLGVKISSENQ